VIQIGQFTEVDLPIAQEQRLEFAAVDVLVFIERFSPLRQKQTPPTTPISSATARPP